MFGGASVAQASCSSSVSYPGYYFDGQSWYRDNVCTQAYDPYNPTLIVPSQTNVLITPKVLDINPTSEIIPGFTRICIKGENFGTATQNWTTKSSLTVGGIDVLRVNWADTLICFTAPEGLQSGGRMVSVNLNINGYTGIQSSFVTTTSDVTNDALTNKQYYLHNINAFTGWQIQSNGNGVVVAVIDDGIYINHPDLRQNIWMNTKETIGNKKDDDNNGYIDDIYGWDFISNTAEMTTRGSHGTMVAGIIGAVKNNSVGIAGIADGAKLMPLIACGDKGCPVDAVIKAIKYAADNGANVINLSLGSQGTTNYTDKYNDAIRYAYNKGVVIVVAAGNGDSQGGIGQSLDQIPVSPVCNDNNMNMVLGVSGVDTTNNYIKWANWGSCVDVVAPALSITSTSAPDFSNSAFYDTEDGTSFSSPIIAGLAALLKAKYPAISNTDIYLLIKRNAVERNGYNHLLGSGEIDIAKTLQDKYIPSTPPTVVSVPPIDLTTTINQISTSSKSFTFIKNLNIGMKGDDITQLQMLLKKLGFLNKDVVASGYFGLMTKKAVMLFQQTNDINMTGFVGAVTRKKLNEN